MFGQTDLVGWSRSDWFRSGDGSKPTRPYILRHLQPILESETAEKICGHLTYIWKMDEHGPCIYDLPDGRFP